MTGAIIQFAAAREQLRSMPHESDAQIAQRRVRNALTARVQDGRMTWVVVGLAQAHAARRIGDGFPLGLAVEEAIAWASRYERAPEPPTTTPPPLVA